MIVAVDMPAFLQEAGTDDAWHARLHQAADESAGWLKRRPH
jgi:hypothetical protein